MTRALLATAWLSLCLWGGAARAQVNQAEPEKEWGGFPGAQQPRPPPPPPRDVYVPPPPPRSYAPDARAEVPVAEPPKTPKTPNVISMFGARPLGQWVRGQSVVVGFPLVSLRVALGLARTFDVGIGFNSFYGLLNEPSISARWSPLAGERWALALQLEVGAAFFTVRAQAEGFGPRWITGRRNFNFQPGVLVSFQGAHPRAARLFLNAYYLLTLDTEPFQRTPLGGTPARVQPGHNAGLKVGAELPLTSYTSLVFAIGAELHLRDGDSLVMPSAAIGLVTSI